MPRMRRHPFDTRSPFGLNSPFGQQGGGVVVPANAIRQRDSDPIKDRSGAFIEVRS